MLRTHKLGEADRIITLLTRQHGRVRAVAKGVRRTTSRSGSRLEPFTHVDLQLAEGRNLDMITQAETLDAFAGRLGAGLRPLHRRHGDARDRRPAGLRGEAAVAPAVPAARRRAAGDDRRRPSAGHRCSTPTCCARWRWPATRRRSTHCARCGDAGPHRWFSPAAGGCSAPTAGSPARPRRGPGRSTCWAPCWPATGRSVDAADPRHLREASGLVAAFLQWHLERGLRSLDYVER